MATGLRAANHGHGLKPRDYSARTIASIGKEIRKLMKVFKAYGRRAMRCLTATSPGFYALRPQASRRAINVILPDVIRRKRCTGRAAKDDDWF